MSRRLRDLIREIRECKTASDEREVISKEAAAIRTAFAKGTEYRPRNIAKLLYMSMLGHNTNWGVMEVVKSLASQSFNDKRIGYLALNVLLDENQEVLMLATHSMKTDLLHVNQFIAGLALTSLGNIASEQIARDCAPEIEQLLSNSNFYVQKKATLCALRIVRKVPDLAEQFTPKLKALLAEKDHGVLVGTVALMIELCNSNGDYKNQFRQKYLQTLIKLLKSLSASGYTPEYDVGNISDPFLQVKILKLLRLLGSEGEADKLHEILVQIATNTDSNRNVGNAILYECVNTIMSIECENELRVMAINTLGKFLSNKDNNIRYVALYTLCKVVDRDTDAVQRHRNTIVDCLKDPDISIRRRALHLIYSLVDANNVTVLVRELLNFLVVADQEFRPDLTAKLCFVSEKYAPNPKWLVDTILRILVIAGDLVPEEVRSNLVNTVVRDSRLHAYAVHSVYQALLKTKDQSQPLVQVAVWIIGEFGDLLVSHPDEDGTTVQPDDVVSLMNKLVNSSTTQTETKVYVITALAKLSVRLGPNVQGRIQALVASCQNSHNIDLQQRACEIAQYWTWEEAKRVALLKRIPPLPPKQSESNSLSSSASSSSSSHTTFVPPSQLPTQPVQESLIGNLLGPINQTQPDGGATPGVDPSILQLIGGGGTGGIGGGGGNNNGVNSILELFGRSGVPPSSTGLIPGLGGPVPGVGTMLTPPISGVPGVGYGVGYTGTPPSTGLIPGLGGPLPGVGGTMLTPPGPAFGGLGFGTPTFPTPTPAPAPAPTPVHAPAPVTPPQIPPYDPQFPPIVAFTSPEFTCTFYFKKPNPQQPQYTLITAIFTSTHPTSISDFNFQAAPPKHLKYILEFPSGKELVSSGSTITQVIKAANSAQGEKPLMMKVRVSYEVDGQKRDAEYVIKNFPANL